MKTRFFLLLSALFVLIFSACDKKDEPTIIPPKEKPAYYDVTIRSTDSQACREITLQEDGSYFVDWTDGFDAYFFLDIQLDEDEMAAGAEFGKYNVLEFEVKGASVVENTPLIIMLGKLDGWPNYCSDCKNFIPISDDWVKVSCNFMNDVPNKAAFAPWTWMRVGVGANAHTPTFYIRNIRLVNPNHGQKEDEPVVTPPKDLPASYDVSVRLTDHERCKEISLQEDGSYFIDWTDGFDSFFFLDIQLDKDDMATGADFDKYNVLEFEVKGASVVENTPLIIMLGKLDGWPNFCSDCKNFIPISDDWVKVTCNFMEDVPNKAAFAPWTWMRVGIGANAHTPTFYMRNIRLIDPNRERR